MRGKGRKTVWKERGGERLCTTSRRSKTVSGHGGPVRCEGGARADRGCSVSGLRKARPGPVSWHLFEKLPQAGHDLGKGGTILRPLLPALPAGWRVHAVQSVAPVVGDLGHHPYLPVYALDAVITFFAQTRIPVC